MVLQYNESTDPGEKVCCEARIHQFLTFLFIKTISIRLSNVPHRISGGQTVSFQIQFEDSEYNQVVRVILREILLVINLCGISDNRNNIYSLSKPEHLLCVRRELFIVEISGINEKKICLPGRFWVYHGDNDNYRGSSCYIQSI